MRFWLGVSIRCVIVDDSSGFREEVRGLLEEQGIEVVADVGSGAEALEQIARLRPNLALVDIDLGGESGLALARRLRELAAGSAGPNVILISTHDESEYADLIDTSSAIGFIAKAELSPRAIREMLGDDDELKPE
jgi:DNA-binding NarL/FixJ family response regulator